MAIRTKRGEPRRGIRGASPGAFGTKKRSGIARKPARLPDRTKGS